MNKGRGHAVVLGGSMAGLLAARVLADAYQRVTIIERDELPDDPHNRRGVPQDRHGHSLLPKGAQVLGALFPGILDELASAGVPVIENDVQRLHFSVGGHHLYTEERPRRPLTMHVPSRPLLESLVRARVHDLSNVDIIDQCEVLGLDTTENRARITGVQIQQRGEQAQPRTLSADLVVDAMGKGARTPAWLEQLGYQRPPEQRVQVDVSYASVLLRIPPEALSERVVLIGAEPGRPKGFALFEYEGGKRVFTVAGIGGHRPPAQRDRMADLVEDFAPEHVLAAIREAEPLTEVATHKFPASRWRRYDRMRRFPDGLIAFGDAISSFNPVYGQGMTVAALEAEALADCLRSGDKDLPTRFFRAAAKPAGIAWQLATGADLALPEIPGPRSVPMRIGNGIIERYLRAAERDGLVAEQFFRVISFLDPPIRLFRPSVVLRVAANILRREQAPAPRELPRTAELRR